MAADAGECGACGLTAGTHELPGGLIHATAHWRVEHCIGPLGVGTLIVKPTRHVTQVAELDDDEASELGPLLRRATDVVRGLCAARQVYVCLWSHGPGHIHFVIQPEADEAVARFGTWGPALQSAMFEANEMPDPGEVEAFAARARVAFGGSRQLGAHQLLEGPTA